MAEESAAAVADAPAEAPSVSEGASLAESSGVPSTPGPAPETPPSAPEPLPPPTPVAPREAPPAREPARSRDASRRESRSEAEPAPPPQASESLLDWHDMIPAEHRNDKVWEKHKTLQEALSALVNQEHLMGRMIPLPREGASDAQMRAFYERLGCPKLASDYVLTDPDMGQDADGQPITFEPDFLTSMLEACHQGGLRGEQAQIIANFAARTITRARNIEAGQVAMQRAQAERDLYDAFGGDAPSMIEKARLFVINMGSGRYGGGSYAERLADKLKTGPLANDIDLIAAFANGFDNFREGIWVGDEVGGSLTSMEQMEADAQALAAVMNDAKRPMDERVAAQKKQFALFQQMNEVREANERRQQTLRR